MGKTRKGVDYLSGIKSKLRPHKYKKERYAIGNFSKKDLSKIIRDFEKLPFERYEKKRFKTEPTDSYFYLAIQIAKCMMRYDALKLHVYPIITEMTDLSSHIFLRTKAD